MDKNKYNHLDNFIKLEEELQSILERYPYVEKINLVYEANRLSQNNLNALELAYSNSDAQIINNEHSGEFESYFMLKSNKLEMCTCNEIAPMSDADKKEELGIERLEEERQSN